MTTATPTTHNSAPKPQASRLVAIGGGAGAANLLRGARARFAHRTAIVAVTDTGRSTGIARALADMPAPGDLRNTLATLADDPDALWPRLLQQRFCAPDSPALDGMAFGNLLLAALTQLHGDFGSAVETVRALVPSGEAVLPVSTTSTHLCAELEDGRVVQSELAVRGLNKPPIRRLFLAPPAAALPAACEAIRQADVVAIGPGSFYTSVLATLLFDGIVDALQQTAATVVFVGNTTTQPGQTDGMRALDHVCRLVQQVGPGVVDVALINRSEGLDAALLAQYAAESLHLLHPDDAELEAIARCGVRPLCHDFVQRTSGKRQLWNKQDTLRHDMALLADLFHQLCESEVAP